MISVAAAFYGGLLLGVLLGFAIFAFVAGLRDDGAAPGETS